MKIEKKVWLEYFQKIYNDLINNYKQKYGNQPTNRTQANTISRQPISEKSNIFKNETGKVLAVGYPRPPKNEKILGNIIVILFWFIVIFLTLYGLGGMSFVLNGVGLLISVPIFGLLLWIFYKIGNRFHWWLDS